MAILVVEKVTAKYKLRSDAVCFYRIWKTVGKGVAQYLIPFPLTGSTLFLPAGKNWCSRQKNWDVGSFSCGLLLLWNTLCLTTCILLYWGFLALILSGSSTALFVWLLRLFVRVLGKLGPSPICQQIGRRIFLGPNLFFFGKLGPVKLGRWQIDPQQIGPRHIGALYYIYLYWIYTTNNWGMYVSGIYILVWNIFWYCIYSANNWGIYVN